jgi:hypothetical protein
MSNFLRIVNGYPRLFSESSTIPIYDQSVAIGSTITSGTSYTLPLSGTYQGEELEIMLDGQVLDSGPDYTFVGAGPTRTQVQFSFDLLTGDNLRFRIIRGP